MVAGVKGVAFLDDDTLAVSSSTAGELFLVSRAKREVLKKIPLGDGVKAAVLLGGLLLSYGDLVTDGLVAKAYFDAGGWSSGWFQVCATFLFLPLLAQVFWGPESEDA